MRIHRALSCLIILSLMAPMTGCNRKNNPLFGNRDAAVTSITLFIPQIDTAQTDLNRVFASVVDQLGNPVTGFQLGNFSVLEGGDPGVPFDVGPVREPLYLVIAIDRSGSMAGANTTAANAAAIDLVNALSSNDYAAIVEFNSDVVTAQTFTNDKTTLINVINAGVPTGLTSLYDAAVQCASTLHTAPGRRLLLVLTDGEDTASTNAIETVISHVNRLGLSAYMVGLGGSISEATLAQIGDGTGGDNFASVNGTDLSAIFLSILARFNNLYYVKYRRRSHGAIKLFLSYGDLVANTTKSLD